MQGRANRVLRDEVSHEARMSKFKVLLIGGIAAGVLAGGTIALFTTGNAPPVTQPGVAVAPTAPQAAAAVNPAERAEASNEKGKTLLFAGKYAEAATQFREALALAPLPKYFFNLALSLYQDGRFDEALTALDGIRLNSPTPDQLSKAKRLREKVHDECRAQKIECLDPWPVSDLSP